MLGLENEQITDVSENGSGLAGNSAITRRQNFTVPKTGREEGVFRVTCANK